MRKAFLVMGMVGEGTFDKGTFCELTFVEGTFGEWVITEEREHFN